MIADSETTKEACKEIVDNICGAEGGDLVCVQIMNKHFGDYIENGDIAYGENAVAACHGMTDLICNAGIRMTLMLTCTPYFPDSGLARG